MNAARGVFNAAGDLLMRPFGGESAWPGLVAWSAVAALLLVGLFRLTSHQDRLRSARNRFVARVLELVLFRHDLRVSLTACWRILVANAAYLRSFAWPFVAALVPMALILIQMAGWFEWRPLRPDDAVVVEVELAPAFPVMETPLELALSDGLRLDSPGVRVAATNEIAWRVRAVSAGAQWADVRVGGTTADGAVGTDTVERKSVVVDAHVRRVSTQRTSDRWTAWLHPAEPSLPVDGPLRRMEVRYPERELTVGSHTVHWTVASLALMMGFGLLAGKVFGVSLA